MANSEIEDLIDLSVYKQVIIDEFGVDLSIPAFKNNKKQWSDRIKELFQLYGKLWSDGLESEIKFKVARKAAEIGLSSLNQHKANSVDALISTVEDILEKRIEL